MFSSCESCFPSRSCRKHSPSQIPGKGPTFVFRTYALDVLYLGLTPTRNPNSALTLTLAPSPLPLTLTPTLTLTLTLALTQTLTLYS